MADAQVTGLPLGKHWETLSYNNHTPWQQNPPEDLKVFYVLLNTGA